MYAQSEPGPTVVTQHETIPNPVFGSTLRVAEVCKGVAEPCAWDAAATWTAGAPPDADSLVIVDGAVQINDENAVARAVGIYPGGQLYFNPATNTQLQSADIVVFAGGLLQIGALDQPIENAQTAQIILRDLPFANDPLQHLRGLVVVDGILTIHGRALAEVYLRAAVEPQAGSDTIALARSALAAGWRVGDEVLLPMSSQCAVATTEGICPDETEERTITVIASDGLTVTLDQPLQFDHPGARDGNGQLDFLPHLLNKSRNVIIRSENPNGVRGHVLLHGRAQVDLRYARLQDLGRTNIDNLGMENQKGRYPLHAHHLIGPVETPVSGYQFAFVGNVVDFGVDNRVQGRKWGLALHDSHYGLIQQNIIDYAAGAGLVTEDGSETGNRITRNFVVRVVGGNNERQEDRDPSDNSKLGRAGVAYWFNGGGGNEIVENVAAAVAECTYCYGFKFDNVFNDAVMIPTAQGADPHNGGGVMTDSYAIGLTQFAANEVYAAPSGLTIWWVCTEFEIPREGCTSTMKDFHVWHVHRWGYFAYETNAMTIDGFVQRGDAELLTNEYEAVIGLYLVDYFQRQTVVRGADIQGVATAIEAPVNRDVRGASGLDVGITHIEDSRLIAGTGIYITSPSSTNGADDLSPQTTIIENVQFGYPTARQSAFIQITGDGATNATSNNPELRNDVWIVNYNTAPGEDGDDLYIVPTYHDVARCDASLGDCTNDMSANYPYIVGGRVYRLADSANPHPTPPELYRIFLPTIRQHR
ncbi:MAG: G8 domain-containing protein [Caldilineaceae bacterium]|nr:G8 domain-containing protein [Caldilineaceae bacterium]